MAAVSKITITEQDGDGRTLELIGSGLPRRGVPFPIVQQIVTDPVPGNADDSIQQTLGPYDDESSWEGFWRTTQLAARPALFYPKGQKNSAPQKIALADSLAFLVDDITRTGHLLAMSWSVGDRKVERLGRIARFEPKYDRPDDVAWSIDWQWVGRGPARQTTTNFRSDQKAALAKSVSLQLAKLTGEIEAAKIVTATQGLPLSASTFSLGALESFLDAPKNLMAEFGNVVRQVTTRVDQLGQLIQKAEELPEELPVELATQMVDLATTCVETCANFEVAVSQKGPEAYVAFDQSASVAALIEAASYFGSAQDQAHTAMQYSAELREAAKKNAKPSPGSETGTQSATPELLAVIVAKNSDTFAGLAARFYTNPDLGSAIAVANNYPAYAVKPATGALLVIPNSTAAQASA